MSSGINTKNESEKIYCGGNKPAWHNHQNLFEGYLNCQDARIAGNLGWDPMFAPMVAQVALADGRTLEVPMEERAVVRSDTGASLGVVKGQYTLFTNTEAFDFVEQVLQTGAGDVEIETCGALWGGKEVFILARKPEPIKIAGDEVYHYQMLLTAHNGKRKVSFYPTNVRVVCANTVALAEQARRQLGVQPFILPHRPSLVEKVAKAKTFFGWANQQAESFQAFAEDMLKIHISEQRFDGIVSDLYPLDQDAGTRAKTMVAERRSRLYRAIEKPDLENFRWTAWGVLQAFADVQTHEAPLRKTESFEDQRLIDVVTGTPTNDKLLALLTV